MMIPEPLNPGSAKRSMYRVTGRVGAFDGIAAGVEEGALGWVGVQMAAGTAAFDRDVQAVKSVVSERGTAGEDLALACEQPNTPPAAT